MAKVVAPSNPSPSAAILDSQSVETATMIHLGVGDDAGKQVKGRKRHILVRYFGLIHGRGSHRR